ncbi:MAG: phosphoglucosamine mutase [Gammaproteobacteria bacterium]|nr:MAG: phosphoglucosamine mutase [Gammaproteobacteria bacterium]
MKRKYFGTDGIRARVGHKHMNPDFAVKLGYAAGRAFKENWTKSRRPRVLIGKDTRISGYMIESALEAGFAAAGVDVRLLGPIPTPAIAYLTRTFFGCAGIVVSASHNPYYDNGIKFFSDRGRKIDDALEKRIEAYLKEYEDKPVDIVPSSKLGKAKRINDAQGRYIEHCKSSVPPQLKLNGLKIVLDCANGANYQVAPAVFRELGAKVYVIHNKPNGTNINKKCGSTHIGSLIKKVHKKKADLGIAFDGDGDRVIMVDSKGNKIDGDAIMYLIAKGLVDKGKAPQGVVGTVMTNMGTIVALQEMGIEFKAAHVGDRHVMEMLNKNHWTLGGESSGHIICLDKSTTGDAIIAALQVLETVINSGQSIDKLLADYQLYPMKMINIPVKNKQAVMNDKELLSQIKTANAKLQDVGRLLVRASGTEEKIRVMVEAKQQKIVDDIVDYFAVLVKQIGKSHV